MHVKRNILFWGTVLVTVVSLCAACQKQQIAPKSEDWVLRAGPYVVSQDTLLDRLKRIALQGDINPSQLLEPVLVKSTARELLNHMVMVQLAKNALVIVPESQVELQLDILKNSKGKDAFDKRMETLKLSEEKLRQSVQENILVSEYLQEKLYNRIVVDDTEIAQAYNEHPEWTDSPERVRVRQIVVGTEEEAQKIRRELWRKTITFADAARKYSIAPESTRGGDLGYFSKDEMPPFFGEQCFKLYKGVISKPLASEYGYHIFMLVDKKTAKKRTLEEAKAEIHAKLFERKKQAIEQQALEKALKSYLMEERFNEVRDYLRTHLLGVASRISDQGGHGANP